MIASNPDNFSSENWSKLKQGSQPEISLRGSKVKSKAQTGRGYWKVKALTLGPGVVSGLLSCLLPGYGPLLFSRSPLLLSLLSLDELIPSQDLPTRICGWLCICLQLRSLARPASHWTSPPGPNPRGLSLSHFLLLRPWPDSTARGITTPSCSNQGESGHPFFWITAILITPCIHRALWKWNETNVNSLVCCY